MKALLFRFERDGDGALTIEMIIALFAALPFGDEVTLSITDRAGDLVKLDRRAAWFISALGRHGVARRLRDEAAAVTGAAPPAPSVDPDDNGTEDEDE